MKVAFFRRASSTTLPSSRARGEPRATCWFCLTRFAWRPAVSAPSAKEAPTSLSRSWRSSASLSTLGIGKNTGLCYRKSNIAPVRLLFVHQNFPGQYRHLAPYFAGQPGNEVAAVGEKANVLRQRPTMPGVKLLGYDLPRIDPSKINPFNASVLRAIHRGRTVARGAEALQRSGFRPDVVFTHLGWGEGLFLKDIFPEAKVLLYCEFFYRRQGGDVGF